MKKINSLFGKCCLLLLATVLWSGSLFAQELILHYTFDDVEGTTVYDESPKANDGVLVNNATISPDGKRGSALYLPTTGVTGSAVDYVHIADGITTNMESFTVATWVKPSAKSQWSRVFDFGAGTTDNMFFTVSAGTNCRYAIICSSITGGNAPATHHNQNEDIVDVVGADLALDEWNHVAVTYDAQTNTCIIYINGVEGGRQTDMTPGKNPTALAGSTQNFIGRAQYNDPGFVGYMDDFRIYNYAMSQSDVHELTGIGQDVFNAHSDFEMESILGENDVDFYEIYDNLNLPTSIPGYEGVVLTWSSSNPEIVSTSGVVTPPTLSTRVKLKVTFSKGDDEPMFKETEVIVIGLEEPRSLVAKWQFNEIRVVDGKTIAISEDDSDNPFSGTLENGAGIRTIGGPMSGQYFDVLDLGDTKGYMDMGEDVGKEFYKMVGYTVGGYFFVPDEPSSYSSAGNFLCTFSNTFDAGNNSTDTENGKNGYMFIRPYAATHSISKTDWTADKGLTVGNGYYSEKGITYTGQWHHIAYSQSGKTGTLYIDGESASSKEITLLPIDIRVDDGREGTLFNWLGRACFASDAYMTDALIYDFRIYSWGMSSSDLVDPDYFGDISETIMALNDAYDENPNVQDDELGNAYTALVLNGLDNVNANITLPLSVAGYDDVVVSWSTSDAGVITSAGVFTAPLYDTDIILTATLSREGKTINKEFIATAKAISDTPFTKDLIVHFDFNQVDGNTVTDRGEQQFKATLMNEATVKTLQAGTETINVLHLGDSLDGTGYLDMGLGVGQAFTHVNEYTLSSYFYIDTTYNELGNNGNFIWSFSGSTAQGAEATPYFIALLNTMRVEYRALNESEAYDMTSYNFYTERQQAEKGVWTHLAYTQNADSEGYVYLNGNLINSHRVLQIPDPDLQMEGRSGTFYNWIGRACWAGDKYLRKTMVADFRLYNRALSAAEMTSELNVEATLELLNNTMTVGIDGVEKPENSYRIYFVNGQLTIDGLQGDEDIALYDIMGRKFSASAQVSPGIYIVKVNNFAKKVLVK
ncbi:hypothetical protein LJB91_01080 [Bacteroidales bacterium OttesenSCG-928-L03]|nr:hypothetical protein [Bacteroidales bacterium OttesenSCG-928-L03]